MLEYTTPGDNFFKAQNVITGVGVVYTVVYGYARDVCQISVRCELYG